MPVQYRRKDVLIEYFGTRLGGLEIRVNGKTVAKDRKLGRRVDDFSVIEDGKEVRYRIARYLDEVLGFTVDIFRENDPVLVAEPVMEIINFGVNEDELNRIVDKAKRRVIRRRAREKLDEYELRDAEAYLKRDSQLNPYDGEIYLQLACVYSMTERVTESIDALENAIARQPDLRNDILIADGLAYTRLQPEFSEFKARHY